MQEIKINEQDVDALILSLIQKHSDEIEVDEKFFRFIKIQSFS